jgi:hypothetical protein
MFRISPKQVTLAPNQRQIVKIAARRPKGLADGEYRSHLKFTVLPEKADEETDDKEGIVLKVMLNYSIPVILRQGEINTEVNIENAKIIKSLVKERTKYEVEVTMSRSGISSSYGAIHAFWKPNGSGEEIKLGILNSVNFYTDLNQATFKLVWQKSEIPPVNGRLRVTYEGSKEFQGVTLAERYFNL